MAISVQSPQAAGSGFVPLSTIAILNAPHPLGSLWPTPVYVEPCRSVILPVAIDPTFVTARKEQSSLIVILIRPSTFAPEQLSVNNPL